MPKINLFITFSKICFTRRRLFRGSIVTGDVTWRLELAWLRNNAEASYGKVRISEIKRTQISKIKRPDLTDLHLVAK
jgi:hypothetical protein